ncbi:MAG: hypothetical protein M0C28_43510 [Candidatus Moduliflexus flocculans]|nr:hypothetical protein [Candidatus Moduliflexus flocculans]
MAGLAHSPRQPHDGLLPDRRMTIPAGRLPIAGPRPSSCSATSWSWPWRACRRGIQSLRLNLLRVLFQVLQRDRARPTSRVLEVSR